MRVVTLVLGVLLTAIGTAFTTLDLLALMDKRRQQLKFGIRTGRLGARSVVKFLATSVDIIAGVFLMWLSLRSGWIG